MRINENQFSKKLREVRGGRSYQKMANYLAFDYKVSPQKLCDLEHQNSNPSLRLIIALYEIGAATPDELLFGGNLPVVDAFNDCYRKVGRDAVKLSAFMDECWALAEAAREKVYSYDTLNFGDAEETEHLCAYRFKEIRKYFGLTAGEVGNRIGNDRSTVYRNEIVREENMPKVEYVFSFCNGMDVSADYILYGAFLGLPKEPSAMLAELPYGVQLELLDEFINNSIKFC